VIKSLLKSIVIKYLNKKKLTIVPYDSREGQLEQVRYNWLIKHNINTVIDVGASQGVFSAKARSLFPNAMIYAFEPIPGSYQTLTEKFRSDNKFKAFNVALGNEIGQKDFFKNQHIGASSFMKISDLQMDAHPDTKNYSKIKVNLDRLDNFIEDLIIRPNIFLKLDVQGYEIEALKGAEKLLEKTKVVFSEVCFDYLYEGQPLLGDINDFLSQKGYKIIGIENIARSVKDGAYLNADVFFIRDG
jgi:FkbM family methyltransferase